MTRETLIVAWTKYPLDIRNPQYTLYQVEVLAYDGNKYVLVETGGDTYSMKYGYLFVDAECTQHLFQHDTWIKVPVDRKAFDDAKVIHR